jgi:hypothetical protein
LASVFRSAAFGQGPVVAAVVSAQSALTGQIIALSVYKDGGIIHDNLKQQLIL